MNDSPVKASPRTLLIIWIAFLIAPILYCIVVSRVTAANEALALPMPISAALMVLALTTIVAGFVLPDIVARQQAAAGGDGSAPLAVYQTSMIVRWACFEAVAVYGFVLTIMSYQLLVAVVASAVSIVLIASSPPRPPRD